MRLYGFVEKVVTMCLVNEIWWLLCSYPAANPHSTPPSPAKKKSWIWILCQNSLTRELKIRFVGLVL